MCFYVSDSQTEVDEEDEKKRKNSCQTNSYEAQAVFDGAWNDEGR